MRCLSKRKNGAYHIYIYIYIYILMNHSSLGYHFGESLMFFCLF
jgi:hypothetical protein